MKSASSPHATPAASADGAASAKQSTPETRMAPSRRPRWRLIIGFLLTFGLCLGTGLLVKREHQRQAALSLLQDCGFKGMAWHGPWGRVHILDALDWDELRSRTFLYPDFIVSPERYLGMAGEWENEGSHEIYLEIDPIEDSETAAMLKELHKSDPLKLLAALQVLRPKMLILRWSEPQPPAFWRRLSQVTSLEGLVLTTWSGGMDDSALQEITRLPHLSMLMVTSAPRITGITDAGLTCLESCPQLKTLSLKGSRVTREGSLAYMRRCPNLLIKLNGEGVPRR